MNEQLSRKFAFGVEEAAELSGLGRTSLYQDIKDGRLPARKRGRRTIVLAKDLRRYLENLPRKGAPAAASAAPGQKRNNFATGERDDA